MTTSTQGHSKHAHINNNNNRSVSFGRTEENNKIAYSGIWIGETENKQASLGQYLQRNSKDYKRAGKK